MGLVHEPALLFLDEADALCDRLLVMDHGGMVVEGQSDVLKRGLSGDVITVSVPRSPATRRRTRSPRRATS